MARHLMPRFAVIVGLLLVEELLRGQDSDGLADLKVGVGVLTQLQHGGDVGLAGLERPVTHDLAWVRVQPQVADVPCDVGAADVVAGAGDGGAATVVVNDGDGVLTDDSQVDDLVVAAPALSNFKLLFYL